MAIKTKKDLQATIKPYMQDEQQTARMLYKNFKERFKLTESFEKFMKTTKKVEKKLEEE